MAVSGVDNTIYLSDVSKRQPKSILGKDDFLILMMKQMQNQDPLNPMDNSQYLAQMAQFSNLEQLTNMSQSFTTSQAFSLVGKNVKATTTDEHGLSVDVTGKVEKATVDGSTITLTVDGKPVSLGNVVEVMDQDVATS